MSVQENLKKNEMSVFWILDCPFGEATVLVVPKIDRG